MPDREKLTPEDKLEILLHILDIIDEQNMITFAEDKFEAYFNTYSKPFVEDYLNALNSKKTLQFMVYGEPGMLSEHFIKVTSPGRIAREIKLQMDMIKAKHKDLILAINEENESLKRSLENVNKNKNETVSEDSVEAFRMTEKIDDVIEYSKKLKIVLKKNKNLEILTGAVDDTQTYLNSVKIISENYDAISKNLMQPLIDENRNLMRRLTFTSVAAIFIVSVMAVMIFLLMG